MCRCEGQEVQGEHQDGGEAVGRPPLGFQRGQLKVQYTYCRKFLNKMETRRNTRWFFLQIVLTLVAQQEKFWQVLQFNAKISHSKGVSPCLLKLICRLKITSSDLTLFYWIRIQRPSNTDPHPDQKHRRVLYVDVSLTNLNWLII